MTHTKLDSNLKFNWIFYQLWPLIYIYIYIYTHTYNSIKYLQGLETVGVKIIIDHGEKTHIMSTKVIRVSPKVIYTII